MALFTDDFNRADGPIGATDWPNNNWNIVANQAVSASGFNPIYNATLLPADSYAEVDVVNADSNEYAGVALRCNPNTGGYSGTLYYAQLQANGFWTLDRYFNGSYSVLPNARVLDYNFGAFSFPFSGRVRLEAIGNVLILSIDGVPHKMAMMAETPASGYSGMLGSTDVTVDNYEAGAATWDIDVDFLALGAQANLPAPWVVQPGAWEIDANGAKRTVQTNYDFALYDLDLGTPDQIVEVDVYDAQGGGEDFIVANARRSGPNDSPTCYQGFWSASNNEITIAKMVNGVYTYLGSTLGPTAPFTGKITLVVTGTGSEAIQSVYANGVKYADTYDQSISTGNYAGVNAGIADRYLRGFRAKGLIEQTTPPGGGESGDISLTFPTTIALDGGVPGSGDISLAFPTTVTLDGATDYSGDIAISFGTDITLVGTAGVATAGDVLVRFATKVELTSPDAWPYVREEHWLDLGAEFTEMDFPLLDLHAHHPNYFVFGYERPGGGQR